MVPIRLLEESDYFGEISLVTNLRRSATVKAEDFCTLAYIGKKAF